MNAPANAAAPNARKRVLFVDHAAALGGGELSLLLLLEHLDRALWEPHLACAGGPLADRAAALGVPVHVTPLPRLRCSWRAPLDLVHGARSLARTVRRVGADILVPFSVRAVIYAAPAALLTGAPFVWYRNDLWLGELPPRYPWAERLCKMPYCALAAHVIANSRMTAQQQPCGRKMTVIHNGIPVGRFDPEADGLAFRRERRMPDDALVLGIVGRLNPIKGQDRFLRVLARVLETAPDAWGLVVGGAIFGEDRYAEGLRELAEELGIAQRVTFTGQLADPAQALAAMDLFVQTGDPEALGLVNLEAMAMGKAVVGFEHGSLPEIVVNGETGRLVPSGDETELAAAVAELLRDPARRAQWGRAGRARAEIHFDVTRVAREVSGVLQRVL